VLKKQLINAHKRTHQCPCLRSIMQVMESGIPHIRSLPRSIDKECKLWSWTHKPHWGYIYWTKTELHHGWFKFVILIFFCI